MRRLGHVIFTILLTALPALAEEPPLLKWTAALEGGSYSTPAIDAEGNIYVGSELGSVYCFDPQGGKKWQHSGENSFSGAIVLHDGQIFAGSDDGSIHVLSMDGALARKIIDGGNINSSPAISPDGFLAVGSDDRNIYGFRLPTTQLWSAATRAEVGASPLIGPGGIVYVGSEDDNFHAIDPSTGELLWTFEATDEIKSSAALSPAGTLLFGDDDGVLHALDSRTGEEIWRIVTHAPIRSSPVIAADGTIVFGTGSGVEACGSSGEFRWRYNGGEEFRSTPVLAADGSVYVGSATGKLVALDIGTGLLRWEYRAQSGFRGSPAIGIDGTLYISTTGGELLALGTTSPLAHAPWPKFRGDPHNTGYFAGFGAPRIFEISPTGMLQLGQNVTLEVAATGSGALQYQWFHDNQVIEGAISSQLPIGGSAEGAYAVEVSNSLGTAREEVTITRGYRLIYGAYGRGSVSAIPAQKIYKPGAVVRLEAQSNLPLLRWRGGPEGTSTAIEITVDANKEVIAEFPVIENELVFSHQFALGGAIRQPAAIRDDQRVFASAGREVVSLHGLTGEKLWERQLQYSSELPLLLNAADGLIYFTTTNCIVFALDQETGATRWRMQTGSLAKAPPVLLEGKLYVAAEYQNVTILDAATGQTFAQHNLGFSTEHSVVSREGDVIFDYMRLRWDQSSTADAGPASSIDRSGKMLYTSTRSLLARFEGGPTSWIYSTESNLTRAAVVGPDGTIFVVTVDGEVHALNPETGALLWKIALNSVAIHPPTVTRDGVLLVSTKIATYGLDTATGALKGSPFQGGHSSSLALGNEPIVYAGTEAGLFTAVKVSGGLAVGGWPCEFHDSHNSSSVADPARYKGPARLRHQSETKLRVVSGQGTWMEVVGVGDLPLAYEWRRSGELIANANEPSLSILEMNAGKAGRYQATVRNASGSETSQDFVVSLAFSLAVETSGAGRVEIEPSKYIFDPGEQLTLQAIPLLGRRFLKWEGSINATDPALTLAVTQNIQARAVFEDAPGHVIWQSEPFGRVSQPAHDGNRLYFGQNYFVRCYDLLQRKELWNFSYTFSNQFGATPVVLANNNLYAVGGGILFALNPLNGQERWRHESFDWMQEPPAIGADGTVYHVRYDGLLALHPRTGAILWKAQMPMYPRGALIGPDGVVYSLHNKLRAHHPGTGAILWESSVDQNLSVPAVIGPDGSIYVAGGDVSNPTIISIDSKTGRERWSSPSRVISELRVLPDNTALAIGLEIGAFEGTTGRRKWSGPSGSGVAITREGILYVVDLHNIRAINAQTGATEWSFKNEVSGELLIGPDRTLYVFNHMGLAATVGDYLPEEEGWPMPRQNYGNTGRYDASRMLQPTAGAAGPIQTATGRRVSIQTVKGRAYTLERGDLSSPWRAVSGTVIGDGGVLSLEEPFLNEEMGFYRFRID